MSADKMMPYKGKQAGSRRQYIKNKPKSGLKLFLRCGISGMIYDFSSYGGNDTFREIQFTELE